MTDICSLDQFDDCVLFLWMYYILLRLTIVRRLFSFFGIHSAVVQIQIGGAFPDLCVACVVNVNNQITIYSCVLCDC